MQTSVFATVVSLDSGFALVAELSRAEAIAIGDGDVDIVTFLPTCRVEGASTQEDAQHIVDAIVESAILPFVFALVGEAMLLEVDFAIWIVVEYLIDGVSVALASSLAEVEGSKVECVVAKEGVAQYKPIVNLVVATSDKARTISFLAVAFALYGVHRSCSSLYPHEFPVVVEVVCEKLARLEGCVSECALCHSLLAKQHGSNNEK